MQSGFQKTAIIIAMWVSMALVSIGVGASGMEAGVELGWGFVLPLLIALVGTFAAWGMDAFTARLSSRREDAAPAKAKRHGVDRLSLLMECWTTMSGRPSKRPSCGT